jgi:HEAT repeat protein
VRRSVTAVLFDELQGPRVEDRLAAAQALGRIDGPETAARLADMAERNVSRREAVAALIWSGDRSKAAAAALEAARRSPRLASTVRTLELTMTEGKRRGGDSRS